MALPSGMCAAYLLGSLGLLQLLHGLLYFRNLHVVQTRPRQDPHRQPVQAKEMRKPSKIGAPAAQEQETIVFRCMFMHRLLCRTHGSAVLQIVIRFNRSLCCYQCRRCCCRQSRRLPLPLRRDVEYTPAEPVWLWTAFAENFSTLQEPTCCCLRPCFSASEVVCDSNRSSSRRMNSSRLATLERACNEGFHQVPVWDV